MPVEIGSTPESPPVEVSASAPAAATVTQDATTPDSSAGKDESLLGRVKAALEPKTEGSSPSQASQDAPPNSYTPSEDDEKEPDSDPTEEEKARYHSKTRKQITRLLTQRNTALDEVKSLKPQAEGFQRVTSFLSDAGISGEEANLLLEVGKNLKRDPMKALEQLKPYYEALVRMSGDVLPDDLQAAVTKGEIAEPYARQLARARTDAAVSTQRAQVVDAASQQRQRVEHNQAHAGNVSSTISAWESNQAKSDPDWNLKQGRIGELIELDIRRNGYPQTAQAAVDLAEKARTAVNTELARFAPRKLAVTPVNPASAARAVAPKPTTAIEAARQALAKTG
jgi:hypothetical protein